jgi:hypothetical protein
MVVFLLDMGWIAKHLVHWFFATKSYMQPSKVMDITIKSDIRCDEGLQASTLAK